MSIENAPKNSAALTELPQVSARLLAEISANGHEDMAARFTEMAIRKPEFVGELIRGMENNADYSVRALVANTLLIGMAERTHGAQPEEISFKEVAQMGSAFNRLYGPVATQRPDLAIAITRAALAEPQMAPFVRDHLATAFADASYSLLRSRPDETVELLKTMASRAQEPSAAFMSRSARLKVADHLAAVSEVYRPHYGNDIPATITGGSITIPAHAALVVAEVVSQFTDSPLLKRNMEKRAKEIGLRLGN